MNDDHDALLGDLFDRAPALPDADGFTRQTLRLIDRFRRRRRLLRLGIEAGVLLAAWIVSEPVHGLVTELMPWVMTSLVDFGDGALSQVLAPMNSIAGVIALLLILGEVLFRRLFRA